MANTDSFLRTSLAGVDLHSNKEMDGAILTVAGIVLMTFFIALVALLPFDMSDGPQNTSTLLGP
jgi:hypothetical protein